MAFSKSRRFSEEESCAPPPTAYHIPNAFEDGGCNTLARPCSSDHHCSQCLAYNKSHDSSVHSNKSNEATQEPLCSKHRACDCLLDNKENTCCSQKNEGPKNSKFKKNPNMKLTEPKAPSFMTRPRLSVHNCLTNSTDETDTSTLFNRHSMKRKSIKVTKENKEKNSVTLDSSVSPLQVSIKPNLKDKREYNVSYTILNKDRYLNSKKKDEESISCDVPSTSGTGTVPNRLSKITDFMKELERSEDLGSSSAEENTLSLNIQRNVEHSNSSEKDAILEKDDSLQKQFLNNFDETKISNNDSSYLEEGASTSNGSNMLSLERLAVEAVKKIRVEIDNALRVKHGAEKEKNLKSYDLPSDIDGHVVLLLANEFIDDDYDSYVKDVTLETLHRMKDTELFQICRSLIHSYMEMPNTKTSKGKTMFRVKKVGIRKTRKNTVSKDIVKLFKKKKNNADGTDIWSEVEKVVRSAITDLKGEFKREIYKKTEEKVDTLTTKLAKTLLKAEEGIESKCERTTNDLINKLGKIVPK